MAKKKKKKVKKKRKSRARSNVVKIEVEAKAPRRIRRTSKRKKKTKKKTKKKATKKRPKTRKVNTEKVQIQMQPILVENFVALQKAMVNLAAKVDTQNTHLNKLLELFELSAKSLAKKGFKLESGEAAPSKEVIEKLGELSEQNKVIARGMTLIHESQAAPPAMPPAPMAAPPTPKPMPTAAPMAAPPTPEEGYKKSAPTPPSKKPVKKASKK
jgi:hypothetical protein